LNIFSRNSLRQAYVGDDKLPPEWPAHRRSLTSFLFSLWRVHREELYDVTITV